MPKKTVTELPDGPPDATGLTPRQQRVLAHIKDSIEKRGYPPSMREIGEAVGLTSSSSVAHQLKVLEEKGFLKRDPTKPRAIEVRYDPNSGAALERRPVRHVPLIGDVAAGTDVLAQENVEELLPLPADFCGDGDLFMVRVRGDSMIDAGILDGDYVVVQKQQTARDGDIVVALAGEDEAADEATVKRFFRENGRIRLQPENESLEPLYPTHVQVLGKVIGVFRRV